MTSLLAPLGFTPGPVLAPLKRQRYDSVHIFYGPKGHPDGVRARLPIYSEHPGVTAARYGANTARRAFLPHWGAKEIQE